MIMSMGGDLPTMIIVITNGIEGDLADHNESVNQGSLFTRKNHANFCHETTTGDKAIGKRSLNSIRQNPC